MERLLLGVVVALTLAGCAAATTPSTTVIALAPDLDTAITAVPTTESVGDSTSRDVDLPPPALFEPWGNAMLEVGELGWEDAFIGPGALVQIDDEFYLLYMAVGNDLVGSTVGYATTNRLQDGFFRRAAEPLFTVADADYLDFGPSPRSAVISPEGTWMLFFHTSGLNGRASSGLIGRATAPGPDGPWAVDPAPALIPGADGSWDDLSVRDPFVISIDGEYRMYYAGDSGDADAHPDRRIGMATSSDGVVWDKYDDPNTGGLYADSDPVFERGGEDAWDELRVFHPMVLPTGDSYVMFYQSTRHFQDERHRTYMYGYAVSDDGIVWQRPLSAPVLTSGTNNAMFGGSVVYNGQDWFLIHGVQRTLGTPSQVELAILRGLLPTD